MAVKSKETKKKTQEKIKIISEKIPGFKEIKEEREEALEEEIIPEEESFETFPEITGMPAPALKPIETLETSLENVPSAETRRTPATAEAAEEQRYEASIYNMQSYMASYEEKAVPTRKNMQEAGILIRPEDIREIKPRTELQEWHEIKEAGVRTRAHHAVLEAKREGDKLKEPWQSEERKYRRKAL